MKPENVALICGGHPSEHDISLQSGATLAAALQVAGYRVHPVIIAEDRRWNLAAPLDPDPDAAPPTWPARVPSRLEGAPVVDDALGASRALREQGVEVVVPALHGADGEDGSIQGFFTVGGFAVAGCGIGASALCIDKVLTKRVLRDAGLPTPDFVSVDRATWADEAARASCLERAASFPRAVVKPVTLGSSVGIHMVERPAELEPAIVAALEVDDAALIEPLVAGLELTCGVRGPATRPEALPVVEIRPRLAEWFDLASKYQPGGADEIVPARLPEAVTREVQDLARRCHTLVGAHGISRTDFIRDDAGVCWILEVNTLPGMTGASLFPKELAAVGASLSDFVRELVRGARRARPLPEKAE